MSLQLADGARSSYFGVPAFATSDRATDLGLIHSLRGRKAAELVQINGGNGDNTESNRAALDPDRSSACFERVHRSLNKFFATRHFMSARRWRWLSSLRSIR